MKQNKEEIQSAIDRLNEILKPGDTICTILRHVSRSGMQREISVIFHDECLDRDVATALGRRIGVHGGIVCGGCGMDMGFELVYSLSQVLWPSGFPCICNQDCPSNAHVNGDRDYTPHHHASGGYAVCQRWM